MAEELQSDLVFVGYTNGYQILYGAESEGGEGSFYSDTRNACYIPLYMLKSHVHRLQTTTDMNVTLERVMEAQKTNA